MKTLALLLLTACGALATGDQLTRAQAYELVRPYVCARVERCRPAQFEREYASTEECLAKDRPKFPRSSEVSECSRPEAQGCINALETQPCDIGHTVECEGC